MRLNAAGAVFLACTMVAAAISIVASHALQPGFARLTGDESQATTIGATTLGAIAAHLPLLRGD